jgi:hypothetical protein
MFVHPDSSYAFSRLDIPSPSARELDVKELFTCIVQAGKNIAEETEVILSVLLQGTSFIPLRLAHLSYFSPLGSEANLSCQARNVCANPPPSAISSPRVALDCQAARGIDRHQSSYSLFTECSLDVLADSH